MKKPIIAIDFDDVLCPTSPLTIDFYNRTYGTNLTMDNAYTYANSGLWLADHATVLQRVNDFITQPEILEVPPIKGAVDVIRSLSSEYSFIVITGRSTLTHDFTVQWLRCHFGNKFDDCIFMEELQKGEPDVSKLDVCNGLGVVYLIDDTLLHLQYFEAESRGVLFGDYPWNRMSSLPIGVTRCIDWAAVKEYFDG
ncbi:MAG: hypothetical protein ABI220_04825 [Candidatus Saccharimonadales bacterium]